MIRLAWVFSFVILWLIAASATVIAASMSSSTRFGPAEIASSAVILVVAGMPFFFALFALGKERPSVERAGLYANWLYLCAATAIAIVQCVKAWHHSPGYIALEVTPYAAYALGCLLNAAALHRQRGRRTAVRPQIAARPTPTA